MFKKDVILMFALATLAAYGTARLVEYFFLPHTVEKEAVRGQSFTAPTQTIVHTPINREIDFVDNKRSEKEIETEVVTQWGQVIFSTDGATMQRFEINRELDGKPSSITTVFPSDVHEKEQRCFLVAFDHETPYYYQLARREDTSEYTTLQYTSRTKNMMVTKTFTIHQNLYRIDMHVSCEQQSQQAIRPRIIYPAPIMSDLVGQDVTTGFVLEQDAIKRFDKKDVPMDKGWYAPTLFGAYDRYFIHALVSDQHSAIERAYFSKTPQNMLLCFLEGSALEKSGEYALSFYFGPKDTDDVLPVDKRLQDLVDYSGWFGPISLLMLKLLKFLYKYFHNYGLAIIALTILVRLIITPLTFKGEEQRKRSLEMDKKMKYIQQKYKDNPERLQQERAELIRKYGFGGGIGCLVPLLQIPLFIALNRLLSTSIELYRAPFVPGWINDLSAPDPLYILPTLFGVSMIVNGLQMDKSQQTMFLVMGVVLGVVFSSFASGLVLFFLVSTLSGVIATFVMKKFKLA